MRRTVVLVAVLALAGTWLASSAAAQTTQQRPRTLAERLDAFGHRLFGGRAAPEQAETVQPDDSAPSRYHRPVPNAARRHNASHPLPSEQAPTVAVVPNERKPLISLPSDGASVTRSAATRRSPARTSSTHAPTRVAERASGEETEESPAEPVGTKLHERLSSLTRSVFGGGIQSEPQPSNDTASAPQRPASHDAAPEPGPMTAGIAPEEPSPEAEECDPADEEPDLADDQPELVPAPATEKASVGAPYAADAAGLDTPAEPAVPEVPAPDAEPAKLAPSAQVAVSESAPATPAAHAAPVDDNILYTRQSPILGVQTIGPRRIAVGKESSYEMTIRNSGEVAAEEVVVTVRVPAWADVTGVEASRGTADEPGSVIGRRDVLWRVGRLEAAGAETLVLKIVPRESRPFDLGVNWDYKPAASNTLVEVLEPDLRMKLDGPREVLYGQKELYRLEILNKGTGDAENLEIALQPMGAGNNPPARHKLGTLTAGQQRVIEVEMTARQTGILSIKVDVRGDAGAEAHLDEKILVRRPGLAITADAPRFEYVGTEATWQFHISNPGTAPAKNAKVSAALPLGVKYVSATGGGRFDTETSEAVWMLENLAPGSERTVMLTCRLDQGGTVQLMLLATADADVSASADAITQVEAIADLALSVSDPSGPVALDQEALYTVEIQNRGTKAATDVEVYGYFSKGIEPVTAEGREYQIGPGQVIFDKIPVIEAGQSVKLLIHAQAEVEGNHIFRAEVYSKPLEARLVSEETTHFYGTVRALEPEPAAAPASAASDELPAPAEPHVAQRPLREGPPAMGYSPLDAETE